MLLAAGAAVNITPKSPTHLAGYADRGSLHSGIHSQIELNAVLLKQGDQTVLIVSADLLFWGNELNEYVTETARSTWGEGVAVFLCASHTHFAPSTDRRKPKLGLVSEHYLPFISEKIRQLLETLRRTTLVRVKMRCSTVNTRIGINRRFYDKWPRVTKRGLVRPSVKMAPNELGAVDNALCIMRLVDERERDVAILWRVGCHPVSFPETNVISSDYPGEAREEIRKHTSPATPVVFLQGFSGDVRPRIIKKSKGLSLKSLLVGPGFHRPDRAEWTQWVETIKSYVREGLANTVDVGLCGKINVKSNELPLSSLLQGSTAPDTIFVRLLALGDSHALLFVNAEVVASYRNLLESSYHQMWNVAYEGDVFGYLPDEEQIKMGGYEVDGFLESFGLQGTFRKDVCRIWNRLVLPLFD